MQRSSTMNRRLTWAAWLLSTAALAGCEESTQVGSGCVEGFCPQALSRNDDACTLTSDVAEIAYTPSLAGAEPFSFCLSQKLQRFDDGMVQVHVYFLRAASAEPAGGCTEQPYLKPVSEELRKEYMDEGRFVEVCELDQLAVVEQDGGAPVVAAGEGFYYDDFSQELETDCAEGAEGRVLITAGALGSPQTTIQLATGEVRTADGDVDPELVCDPMRGSEPVGTACDPMQDSYDDNQVVLATRSNDCGDGVCLAYHWDGETEPSCEHADGGVCPTQTPMDKRVYCTCRCDGPPGADLCECPDHYSCVDVITAQTRADLAGSYCVKNGEEAL